MSTLEITSEEISETSPEYLIAESLVIKERDKNFLILMVDCFGGKLPEKILSFYPDYRKHLLNDCGVKYMGEKEYIEFKGFNPSLAERFKAIEEGRVA